MAKNRKQAFLHGAMVLMIAVILVKLIGWFFKVPLNLLIGNDGMGIFAGSYQMYTFMFAVATSGFPIAVSKMVAEATAKENKEEANKVFYISLVMLGVIGLIGTAILYFFAQPLSGYMKNERTYYSILAISPAVFFIAVTSSFRGYFQGKQNMYPTAFSELIEALGKLLFGYFFAAYLIKVSLEYAAAGAAFGVTCGTILSFLLMISIFLSSKSREKKQAKNIQATSCKSTRRLMKELLFIVIPVTIGASISSLTNVVDLFTVTRRLQDIPGITDIVASTLYGAYSNQAITMFNFPLTIVTGLSMSVMPAIAGALALKRKLEARKFTEIVLRITVLFAIPCAVGLSVLATPILKMIFLDKALAFSQLQILALAILFVSVVSVSGAVLQAYGRMKIPVINMIIGGIIKVLLNYTFIPAFGIDAAPVSTCICYLTIATMNLVWVIRISGAQFKLWDFYLKPIIAVAAMAVCVIYANNMLTTYGLNEKLSCIISASFGGLIYFILLFVVQAIKQEDIEMLPRGPKLVKIFKRIHFLRN